MAQVLEILGYKMVAGSNLGTQNSVRMLVRVLVIYGVQDDGGASAY